MYSSALSMVCYKNWLTLLLSWRGGCNRVVHFHVTCLTWLVNCRSTLCVNKVFLLGGPSMEILVHYMQMIWLFLF